MHFFDPTLDWPPELIKEEIPDLVYLKSSQPLNLSNRLLFSSASSFGTGVGPWVEYESVRSGPSITLLFIDVGYVQQQQIHLRELRALLQDLISQNVEVARYRRMQGTFAPRDDSLDMGDQIRSWAFRSLSAHTIRPSLAAFESFSRSSATSMASLWKAGYRKIPSPTGLDDGYPDAPHSIFVSQLDYSNDGWKECSFSQELVQEHSIVEKASLRRAVDQRLGAFSGPGWNEAMSLLP